MADRSLSRPLASRVFLFVGASAAGVLRVVGGGLSTTLASTFSTRHAQGCDISSVGDFRGCRAEVTARLRERGGCEYRRLLTPPFFFSFSFSAQLVAHHVRHGHTLAAATLTNIHSFASRNETHRRVRMQLSLPFQKRATEASRRQCQCFSVVYLTAYQGLGCRACIPKLGASSGLFMEREQWARRERVTTRMTRFDWSAPDVHLQ